MTIQSEVKSLLDDDLAHRGASSCCGQGADEAFRAFEARWNVVVPAAVREWLKMCNGALAGEGRLLGIATDPQVDIARTYEVYDQWPAMGWLPVADDGCGNYYVAATKAEGAPVYFIETIADENSPEYAVGSDIWHFLRSMLQRCIVERDLPFDQMESNEPAAKWPFDRHKVLTDDPALQNVAGAPKPWALG